jgi:hypothetical protein
MISPVSLYRLIKNRRDLDKIGLHPEIQAKCKGFDFQAMFSHSISSRREQISQEDVTRTYKKISASTQFDLGDARVPVGIEECIGLHIRVGDKINMHDTQNPDYHIKYTVDEFQKMQMNAFQYLVQKIQSGESRFYVCSDDDKVKHFFVDHLRQFGAKEVVVNEPSGDVTLDCMLDMWCLSRCKQICMLSKVSTFSFAAALIGDKPVHVFYEWYNPYLDVWKDTIAITTASSSP